MLAAALEAEVAACIDAHARELDEQGRRLVVRNGHACGLSDAGHLRPGITIGEVADILWTYSSPNSTTCSSASAAGQPNATASS